MMSVCKLLCTTEGFGVSNLEIICYHPQKKIHKPQCEQFHVGTAPASKGSTCAAH